MIAMVAQFYGWSFKEILALPIRAFFAFHEQAIKMEARQFRELAYLTLQPAMNLKYHEKMIERYTLIIDPESVKKPPRPSAFTLVSGSPEALDVMKQVFYSVKRGMGYG